ncbi:hypothetical protein KAFR_0E01450 [Kazachstania africana CBS 2517]|uniref:Inositol-1-monophosphatase n=1 Tax=Kazachstania africana (strain ATCC 22294 / BCRC 22015 / CBS 2517 / CECT 1963 / NBRC 1671 / NRRL Y-8276) TaxID=1071382 RepID=H2AV99_KAZAF|nr:hypothetical protein KAFR_0E01450 [Kazachstania africana CBS 2517]CCF58299.1 hypothetical protein KAFR_0E01450 [Kazachstania africana CBS 2517]
MNQEQLKQIENAIVGLLKNEVGPIIKTKAHEKSKYVNKSNAVDLVTETDKQIEVLIKEKLGALYPDFKFIGEESYQPGVTKISDEPTFIVDPIDGTTNFIHDFPFSCCSIGLSINQEAVVGAVYNPHLGQLFHGSKGNGAFLNDTKIVIAERPLKLQQSVIGFEGGAERQGSNFEVKMSTLKNLLDAQKGFAHGFRSLGSAAMNMCYTALGTYDAYWEGGCYAWDVCAGWCILKETGGMVVGGNVNEWEIPLDRRCYFAIRGGSSEDEQKKFVQEFWNQVPAELKY